MPEPSGEGTLKVRANQAGVPWLEIIPDECLDPILVDRFPVEWARRQGVLPIRYNGRLALLTSDPHDFTRLQEAEVLLGCELLLVATDPSQVKEAIDRCYVRRDDRAEDFLRDLQATGKDGAVIAPIRGGEDLLRAAEEAPVIQLINLILLEAVKARASDIHFEPFENRLKIRYRIDGILYEQSSPPKQMEKALVSRLKVMARMDIAEKRLPQDGMTRVRIGEREIDIRVSTVPVAEGERVVLRLLNRENSLLPLEALGIPERIQTTWSRLLRCANGLVIVSGPTGSGKTTTLYAALSGLDTLRRNILTIEDPIEYQLPHIGQIQVHPKIGLTFAVGLRHLLRQDPDVILVGETRDRETADIALRAALTGHLVFTTLHTNDATSAVLRLTDMGIEPFLLAAALRGVLAQRLVRRLCPECCRIVSADAETVRRLGPGGLSLIGTPIAWPVGCANCREGFRGRIGLFELMPADPSLQDILRGGQGQVRELRRMAVEKGMVTMLDDGIDKIRHHLTTVDEVVFALNQTDDG
jgi:general secretion pathway protein E